MGKHLIGLFGGTFNPIHVGHLNLALELREKANLDEVWFIPSNSTWRQEESVTAAHRLQMVKLAVEGIEGFQVLDLELNRPGPSYTIETVRELKQRHPQTHFMWLVGEDAAFSLPQWREGERLIQEIDFVVGSRGFNKKIERLEEPFRSAVLKNYFEIAVLDISATHVRHRIKNKLYATHLVPPKVMDYIYENQLYYGH